MTDRQHIPSHRSAPDDRLTQNALAKRRARARCKERGREQLSTFVRRESLHDLHRLKRQIHRANLGEVIDHLIETYRKTAEAAPATAMR
jgi:hypothetical protein